MLVSGEGIAMNDGAGETGCPFTGTRKTTREAEATLPDAPRIEQIDGVWHVRSLPAVREVLRSGRTTVQAGFNAESVGSSWMRRPILYVDGEEHRQQRAKLARYFAPKTVDSRYRDFMNVRAQEIVARIEQLGREGEVDLAEPAMRFSVEVAAQVIGLGGADMRGISARMERFFAIPALGAQGGVDPLKAPPSRLTSLLMSLRGSISVIDFFVRDVRPAVRQRRAQPRNDVISHCIEQGYTDAEILTECVTYAAAGMVTTREFISMATWHMLSDAALRERFLADVSAAGAKNRYAILEEILRLEPVVGHLYRRTLSAITICDGEDKYEIPENALLDLYIRAANADPDHVGESPMGICPGRPLPSRTGGEVLSFGDGGHKCPGQHVALQESDAFLTRLLQLPLRLVSEPKIGWADLISGYEVRNLRLRVG
ncbi:cytochrome P450 [Dermatophilus congolensis]|uniref:cytochrome P450 n=1 Tax=Dermatophilus congolensis TaxID=1863 RepID=UPI001FBACAA4|nr:cytochrome P450 [Dermatophilus congolensis]